mgnify:FL=1
MAVVSISHPIYSFILSSVVLLFVVTKTMWMGGLWSAVSPSQFYYVLLAGPPPLILSYVIMLNVVVEFLKHCIVFIALACWCL